MMAIDFTESDLAQIAEGKTKIIYEIAGHPTLAYIRSKDKISCWDGKRQHNFEGKSSISNLTTCTVFEYLLECGLTSHYKYRASESAFVAEKCSMIPIEFVTRRVATGSFLKRNPGVKEGYRFAPPKLEMFFKDDENGDPQWTEEMLLEARLSAAGVTIDSVKMNYMLDITRLVFELLERAWSRLGCTLVDMKIEFGVNSLGQIVLADVIDSDSWRLWPNGDRRLQVDKQFYRDLETVTADDLKTLRNNFVWVSQKLSEFVTPPKGRVVVLMGSENDMPFCEKISLACNNLHLPVNLRVSSAHKGTSETISIIQEYEADPITYTVFICVAGRSNGLGPVTAGNTVYPVINCPPIGHEWGGEDIWSSLRLPSGLGCTTVLGAEAAALAAATIISQHDHMVWCKLRCRQVLQREVLRAADSRAQLVNQVQMEQLIDKYAKHAANTTLKAHTSENGTTYTNGKH